MPADPRRLAALVEVLEVEAALAAAHHHHHHPTAATAMAGLPELDRIVAELDVAERRLPSGARRLLTPAERRAGTRFADFADEVDDRTERLTARMVTARAAIAADLDALMARAAAGDLADVLGDHRGPRAIGELLRTLDDPARSHLLGLGQAARIDLARHAREELAGALVDGYARAAGEAASQGMRTGNLPGPLEAAALPDLDDGVDRIASAPRRQAVGLAVNAGNAIDYGTATVDDTRVAVRSAVDEGAESTLRNEARPEVHRATGLGRAQAASDLPQPERIYASELMDGATCGPCSLVDGREYANLDDARLDYPAGRYVRCEGGDRCRGTLVFVWPEADVTLDPPGPPWQPPPPPPPPATPIGPDLPDPPPAPAAVPTREAAAALEREARLEARRQQAAADRAAERAELDVLIADGWTPDQVAAARRDLEHYRARARLEAEQAALRYEDALEQALDATALSAPPRAVSRRVGPGGNRVEVRRLNPDGTVYTGGEWDWYDALSESEKKRLRRRWVGQDTTTGPDQLARVYADTFGDQTVDAALARWLDLNRRADAARAMARGRLPSRSAYGDLDPEALLADSPFDAATLFGSDTGTATRRILERYDDEAAAIARREAADQATETLGTPPWEMTEADYTFEVDLIREVIADPDLVPVVDFDDALGRPRYDPDVEQEFARLGELIPPEFSALDLAPADLYRAIVEWADRAGLRAHIEAFSEGRTA